MTVKLSDWIFRYLADQGVKHVFMLTGGGAMHLNDSLGMCKDIEYICTSHEQAAAMAAESYAKVVGDIGVCLVTAGPGGTNAITGVAGMSPAELRSLLPGRTRVMPILDAGGRLVDFASIDTLGTGKP